MPSLSTRRDDSSSLVVTVIHGSHTTVVSVRGELDLATAAAFETELAAVSQNHPGRLLVDLSGLRFLGCAGLHALHRVALHEADLGRTLAVHCPNPQRRRLFALTGIDAHIQLAETAEHASVGAS